MFVLCAAFAGPLLPKLDIEAGGFHLVGCSSVGKTTLLDVAGSVWGGVLRLFSELALHLEFHGGYCRGAS